MLRPRLTRVMTRPCARAGFGTESQSSSANVSPRLSPVESRLSSSASAFESEAARPAQLRVPLGPSRRSCIWPAVLSPGIASGALPLSSAPSAGARPPRPSHPPDRTQSMSIPRARPTSKPPSGPGCNSSIHRSKDSREPLEADIEIVVPDSDANGIQGSIQVDAAHLEPFAALTLRLDVEQVEVEEADGRQRDRGQAQPREAEGSPDSRKGEGPYGDDETVQP